MTSRNLRRLAALGAITLLWVELFLRILVGFPAVASLPEGEWPWNPDPLLGWIIRPPKSYDVWIRTPEFEVHDRYNSLGLLNEEVDEVKPPGTLRILAIGDSLTEARQVSRSARFTGLIESELSKSSTRRVEVLNAGQSGFQTDQELLLYERDLGKLGSDIVILFVYPYNDVPGNVVRDDQKPRFVSRGDDLVLEPRASFRVSTPEETVTTRVKDWLKLNVLTYRTIAAAWHKLSQRADNPYSDWALYQDQSSATDEAWHVTELLLRRMANRVTDDAAKLLIAFIPADIEVRKDAPPSVAPFFAAGAWDWDLPYRRLSAICDRSGLHCLDLLPKFRSSGSTLHFPTDKHLTPEGHRVVAREILRELRSLGWVP